MRSLRLLCISFLLSSLSILNDGSIVGLSIFQRLLHVGSMNDGEVCNWNERELIFFNFSSSCHYYCIMHQHCAVVIHAICSHISPLLIFFHLQSFLCWLYNKKKNPYAFWSLKWKTRFLFIGILCFYNVVVLVFRIFSNFRYLLYLEFCILGFLVWLVVLRISNGRRMIPSGFLSCYAINTRNHVII